MIRWLSYCILSFSILYRHSGVMHTYRYFYLVMQADIIRDCHHHWWCCNLHNCQDDRMKGLLQCLVSFQHRLSFNDSASQSGSSRGRGAAQSSWHKDPSFWTIIRLTEHNDDNSGKESLDCNNKNNEYYCQLWSFGLQEIGIIMGAIIGTSVLKNIAAILLLSPFGSYDMEGLRNTRNIATNKG